MNPLNNLDINIISKKFKKLENNNSVSLSYLISCFNLLANFKPTVGPNIKDAKMSASKIILSISSTTFLGFTGEVSAFKNSFDSFNFFKRKNIFE